MPNTDMKTPGSLQIAGGIITALFGLAIAALGAIIGSAFGDIVGMGGLGAAVGSLLGAMFIVCGIFSMLAGFWYERKPQWAWIGLMFSLFVFAFPFGGFYLGPFLSTIGAAMAMAENAKTAATKKNR